MPPSFHSIYIFRESLNNLCKKEKYGYHSCKQDICDLLKDDSFEEIWNMNYKMRDLENIRIVKLRIQNSLQNLSKSDGFRVIICCNKKYQTINFLNIYPKRGKCAQLDQPREEFKRQLRVYLEEFKLKKLVTHDINNNLNEVPNQSQE